MEAVQRRLRDVLGVTAIIFDQDCATEKRRKRKRKLMPPASMHVRINEEVCEGCGDCGVQSNCVAIVPKETELGRKRAVDTAVCNSDLSCNKGFCPSFITIAGRRRPSTAAASSSSASSSTSSSTTPPRTLARGHKSTFCACTRSVERSQESRHTQHRSEGLNMDARGPQHGCAAAHMKGRPGSGMCARRVHVLVTLVACALSALTSPWRLWAAAGLLHAETTAQVLMRRSRPALCAGGRRSFPTRPVHSPHHACHAASAVRDSARTWHARIGTAERCAAASAADRPALGRTRRKSVCVAGSRAVAHVSSCSCCLPTS
eukprot:Tamp_21622.p1 GENE.Tamp_21622~~Tamp_21622.p1  ORF type:complete len:340 (+),score=31.55 Tamp_21622:67-1020(+)